MKRAVSQGKIVLGVSGFVAGSVILSSARRLRRFRGALRWRIGFLMSGQSGNDILCVAAGCGFKGNSGRLFDHFWKVHRAEDWPPSWIERFRLSQCPKCLPWYSRLISHTPKCYATRECGRGGCRCRGFRHTIAWCYPRLARYCHAHFAANYR